ncbi:substrate-binding protein [Bradyrhizobium yuanmingense]|uniref:Substrate-binding protein n=1 Tax=Bradyrhizobium yuanmingense TaxID=108015 RepID=A0A1C3VXG8_9BRAD|nr:ABC transporter substrate-binding protein [Bradyrhizobium yuanmingense]TWI29204.1 substrate-binding family protein [Bradyrhizobium yuanmingense]SCB32471.1 substrate-binding protein [Bradyrhizobium yuanmingense]
MASLKNFPRGILSCIGALLLSLYLVPAAAQSSDDRIKIAIIEDLSGPLGERGQKAVAAYQEAFKRSWPNGYVSVGSSTFKLETITYDAGGKPDVAAMYTRLAIQNERVAVVFSPHISSISIANDAKVPLILTSANPNLVLDKAEASTFYIRAPSTDDFGKQIKLAVRTLHDAMKLAPEPSSEKLIRALRDVQVTAELDQIRFDKFGNNTGRVVYRFRPDAAGCSDSCGTTCPTNCGDTACSKSGGNECCSICGMPRPK